MRNVIESLALCRTNVATDEISYTRSRQPALLNFLRKTAARARHCLILLPLHDGDETYDSWKPLLNTSRVLLRLIGMNRAIKQKSDMLAGAASAEEHINTIGAI